MFKVYRVRNVRRMRQNIGAKLLKHEVVPPPRRKYIQRYLDHERESPEPSEKEEEKEVQPVLEVADESEEDCR